MNNPLVSICIPTYNGQSYIETCIDSAVRQTYRNIEIIIVDDCSSDNSFEIAKKYAAEDSGIKIYRNEKNLGLVANWNKCIELSQGEWIKFLFQDDYLDINCIETMIMSLSEEDKIITSGRRFIFDPEVDEPTKKHTISEILTLKKLGINSTSPVFITPKKLSAYAVANICINFIGEPTAIMFRKDVVSDIGYFNTDLFQICDLEFFLRISSNYGIKYIPQALSYFRIHKLSSTSLHLKNKSYTLSHIDTIIMVHQMIYDSLYLRFRKLLSLLHLLKLKLYFKTRVFESYKTAKATSSENLNKFNSTAQKYPEIQRYKDGSLLIQLLLKTVILKRAVLK